MKQAPAPSFMSGFAILLACWLLGEFLSRALQLSLPGTVAGMLILLGLCLLRRHVPTSVESASHGLLSHLSLLFVPAGVGIMQHTSLLARYGLAMLVTLVLSTVITLAVTGLVLKHLLKSGDEA